MARSKISLDARLPPLSPEIDPGGEFGRALQSMLTDIAAQLNRLSEDRITAHYGAQDTQPLGMELTKGDLVRDNAPSEAGTAGSKYVRLGWLCIDDGTATAATTVEVRGLTGN